MDATTTMHDSQDIFKLQQRIMSLEAENAKLRDQAGRMFTGEQWGRLRQLLSDRLHARITLMNEALTGVVAGDPGGEIAVSIVALDGACYMSEDMLNELNEALTILDF